MNDDGFTQSVEQNGRGGYPATSSGQTFYHNGFTIPDDINPITVVNQQVVYDILFRAGSETLIDLCKYPKHIGAQIGLIAVFIRGIRIFWIIPICTALCQEVGYLSMKSDGLSRRRRRKIKIFLSRPISDLIYSNRFQLLFFFICQIIFSSCGEKPFL